MSGICGAYGKGDIEEMTRMLSHRGPDDRGFYLEGPLQLGVSRLAIVDLAGGHQPVSNEDQTRWVMLDGEVFNYPELSAELTKLGHQFQTHTDTEVVAHAWEEWGPASLDRFNGQFALAIWDGKKLHLIRDRLGEKPLYYYHRSGRFLFASEIKSLLTQVETGLRFTDEFRDFEAPLAPDTLFANIWELPAGHRLTFDGRELELRQWWEVPTYDGEYSSPREYVDELRWLLTDAVALRLRGDVPVGAFLSGGIDSAVITCLAKPEHVFTVSFKEAGEAFDELAEARLIAERIEAKLHVVRPGPGNLSELLPRMIWHLDQPVASTSSLPMFMSCEAAKKWVKAVLIGQGADELFGGHVRYLLMAVEGRIGHAPALRHYLPLARYFWNPEMFTEPANRYYTLVSRGPGIDKKVRQKVHELFARHQNLVDQMGYTDLKFALPTVLTLDDRAAAAHGIENRNPFLDHRIVEFAFRIPPALKVDRYVGKVIVRQAMRGIVPDPILDRLEKKGLAVPVGKWFKKELKKWSEVRLKRFRERPEADFLNAAWDAAGDRGEFDRKDYMKVCLELWLETMFTKDQGDWDKWRLAAKT